MERFLAIMLLSVVSSLPAFAEAPDKLETAITAKLWIGDSSAVDSALRDLQTLDARAEIDYLRSTGMQKLMELGRAHAIVGLVQSLILRASYYTNDMEFLVASCVRAELASNEMDQALQDAKRLYNVAAMADMEKVMLLLEECLTAAHPDDHEIVGRFRREQINGYDQPGAKCAVLEQIKIDPGPYAAGGSAAGVDAVKSGQGNLLLLAGKTSEALTAFQTAEKNAANPDANALAVAGIARAMKAQDGTVGRANHYLRERLENRVVEEVPTK